MIKKMLRVVGYVFTVLIFLIGAFIFIFPLWNNYTTDKNTEEALEDFRYIRNVDSEKGVNNSRPENTEASVDGTHRFDKLYEDMQKYNEDIYNNGQSGLKDAWAYEQSGFDLSMYGIYNGVVGEIRIPKMNVDLPIYLGATTYNMGMGATQLGQTSMPIGGENTNCVIAGHRGSTGGRFFLDIEMLEIGDKVYIDNLWETLTYRVSKIDIIDPYDIEKILIQKDKDMLTLITCHPYPYMFQRYIVYCERISNDNSEQNSNADSVKNQTTDNASISEIISEPKTESEVEKKSNSSSQTFIVFEKALYILVPLFLIVLSFFLFKKVKAKK